MSRFAGVAILAAALVAVPGLSAAATATADFALEQLSTSAALTTLRSIAGARELEVVGERVVRVAADADTLAVARAVLDAAEHPYSIAEEIPTYALADGSILACARLDRASVPSVMTALRKEVRVARFAVNSELSTVIVRDTPPQVASALALIRRMEIEEHP